MSTMSLEFERKSSQSQSLIRISGIQYYLPELKKSPWWAFWHWGESKRHVKRIKKLKTKQDKMRNALEKFMDFLKNEEVGDDILKAELQSLFDAINQIDPSLGNGFNVQSKESIEKIIERYLCDLIEIKNHYNAGFLHYYLKEVVQVQMKKILTSRTQQEVLIQSADDLLRDLNTFLLKPLSSTDFHLVRQTANHFYSSFMNCHAYIKLRLPEPVSLSSLYCFLYARYSNVDAHYDPLAKKMKEVISHLNQVVHATQMAEENAQSAIEYLISFQKSTANCLEKKKKFVRLHQERMRDRDEGRVESLEMLKALKNEEDPQKSTTLNDPDLFLLHQAKHFLRIQEKVIAYLKNIGIATEEIMPFIVPESIEALHENGGHLAVLKQIKEIHATTLKKLTSVPEGIFKIKEASESYAPFYDQLERGVQETIQYRKAQWEAVIELDETANAYKRTILQTLTSIFAGAKSVSSGFVQQTKTQEAEFADRISAMLAAIPIPGTDFVGTIVTNIAGQISEIRQNGKLENLLDWNTTLSKDAEALNELALLLTIANFEQLQTACKKNKRTAQRPETIGMLEAQKAKLTLELEQHEKNLKKADDDLKVISGILQNEASKDDLKILEAFKALTLKIESLRIEKEACLLNLNGNKELLAGFKQKSADSTTDKARSKLNQTKEKAIKAVQGDIYSGIKSTTILTGEVLAKKDAASLICLMSLGEQRFARAQTPEGAVTRLILPIITPKSFKSTKNEAGNLAGEHKPKAFSIARTQEGILMGHIKVGVSTSKTQARPVLPFSLIPNPHQSEPGMPRSSISIAG